MRKNGPDFEPIVGPTWDDLKPSQRMIGIVLLAIMTAIICAGLFFIFVWPFLEHNI